MSTESNVERIMQQLEQLPSLPAVAVLAMDLAMDEKSSMDRIANIVEKDPALTSKILKTANSSFFGRPGRVSNLQQAIVLLGTSSLRSLVLTVCVVDTFNGADENDDCFNKNHLWQHSLLVAIGSRIICDILKIDEPDDMFIAGLLHDIGVNLLSSAAGDEYKTVYERFQIGTESLEVIENEILGVDHAEIGKNMLNNWKFPSTTSDLVGYHHNIKDVPRDDSMLLVKSKILYIADALAFQAGYGYTLGARLVDFDSRVFDDIGLEVNEVKEITKKNDR